MENFNMIKENKNEGQTIHQLVIGDGYISGLWQWPNMMNKYIIQKKEQFIRHSLLDQKRRGRFKLWLKLGLRQKIYQTQTFSGFSGMQEERGSLWWF